MPLADGDEGGLVQQIGEIGTCHAGRASGDGAQIDVVGEHLGLGVDLEDLEPVVEFGQRHDDLTVEASRAQ